MIVVASGEGRRGIRPATEALRRGGTALDAVVTGIEAVERESDERADGIRSLDSPASRAQGGRVLTLPELVGTQPEVWDRWRRCLADELSVEAHALARMEWLIGLATAVIGPSPRVGLVSFVARDRARDIACGVGARAADQGGDTTRRVVLALRAGRAVGDALREALIDFGNLAPPLGERINMHALARDRVPLGASHREGETFLYVRAGTTDYIERDCLHVA